MIILLNEEFINNYHDILTVEIDRDIALQWQSYCESLNKALHEKFLIDCKKYKK